MPIYSYGCVYCDIDVDKERGINDPEPTYFCEGCGYKMIRIYSAVPTVFKAGGFYKTDNKR